MMPSGEALRRADWCVLPVSLATCQRLVAAHHYARGGSSAAVFCHGLFRRGDHMPCLGVAWWTPPALFAARGAWDGDPHQVLCLHRLAIAPEVPANGASFLIGESIQLVRVDGRYRCLITYADTAQGHTGAIYRATNWEYLGLVSGHATWTDPATGRLVSDKIWTGTRNNSEMRALGYEHGGRHPKHKFRLILPPARPRRGLFTAMEVPA